MTTIDISSVMAEVANIAVEDASGISADQNDIANFEQAMSGGESNGLGSTLVDQFFDLKKEYNTSIETIHDQVSGGIDNPAELMKVQFELAKVSLQQEMIAKGAGKTTQNIETLIKAQ